MVCVGSRSRIRFTASVSVLVILTSRWRLFLYSYAMVRSYERHEPTAAFSLVSSNSANGVLGKDGRTAYLPGLEDVLAWDMKLVALQQSWHEVGFRMAVTAIACAPYPNDHRFAVGYSDGSIRLWDSNTQTSLLTFNGHQRAVTSLAFDAVGVQLASGSQDTTIIVWDTVAEQGLFRYVDSQS